MNGKKNGLLRFGIGWFAFAALLLGALSFFADTEWIRAAGLFLAGVGAAPLGLLLAHSRTASLSSQTENEIARRVTDSFTKAVELLGHAEIAVRQGGIYALGRIAAENREEHPKIMSIIAAYIRHRSRAYVNDEHKKGDNKSPPWDEFIKNYVSKRSSPIDLEAAVAVIRERNAEFDAGLLLDLSESFLFRVNFSGAPLSRVDFSRSVLRGCNFEGAALRLADMGQADFTNSNFNDADMTQIDAEETIFDGANMRGVNFERMGMRGAMFSNANLGTAKFNDVNLCDAIFHKATLMGAKFNNVELRDARFRNAGLIYATFNNVRMKDADFSGAKLSEVNFDNVVAECAIFDQAELFGADLTGIKELTAEQIKTAQGNAVTKLPQGMEHPAHWLATYHNL